LKRVDQLAQVPWANKRKPLPEKPGAAYFLPEQAIACQGEGENIEREIKERGKRRPSKAKPPRSSAPVVLKHDMMMGM